jgi:hypothetical protein
MLRQCNRISQTRTERWPSHIERKFRLSYRTKLPLSYSVFATPSAAMASLRRLPVAQNAILRPRSRLLSTTRVVCNEAVPNLGTVPAQKKPIGGFRGGFVYYPLSGSWFDSRISSIVGFLFGFSLAASFAAFQLLDEYKQASAALQSSVEELRINTEKVNSMYQILALFLMLHL